MRRRNRNKAKREPAGAAVIVLKKPWSTLEFTIPLGRKARRAFALERRDHWRLIRAKREQGRA